MIENRRGFLAAMAATAAGLAVVPFVRTKEAAAFSPYPLRRIDIGPSDSIQEAIDYAAAHGASVGTSGSTEQGGGPWVVVLNPGEYNQSGIVMKPGVNLTSLMERTALILADDSAKPLLTWNESGAISGITLEQLSQYQPAVRVGINTPYGKQASIHRCIIGNAASENVPAIEVNGGFLRAFQTDIRRGQVRLAPIYDFPLNNPVAVNLLYSRLWAGNIVISGPYPALLMLGFCALGGKSVLSANTNYVYGRFHSVTNMGKVVNAGTGPYTFHLSELAELQVKHASGTADIWGGHIGAVSDRTGTVTFHPGVVS